ncbi:MAG: hypothetical protein OEV93_02250 [Candidatus Moranbacteria bacterium]|nr:hypothetical protein [Candidatus Moranbacteria bacterium]
MNDFDNHEQMNNFNETRNKEIFIQQEERSIPDHYGNDVILEWNAPEYVHYKKEQEWYIIAGLLLSAIIIYALVKNSPLMAITFILIGVVGYIHLEKEPRNLRFRITHDGVIADKELYEFEDIKSFWIFYEPEFQVISLRTDSHLLPFVHIPIHNEDPLEIRDILLKFIPEAKHKPSLVDSIERAFHI